MNKQAANRSVTEFETKPEKTLQWIASTLPLESQAPVVGRIVFYALWTHRLFLLARDDD